MLFITSYTPFNFIGLILLLTPLVFTYPNCDPILYGTPPEDDCHDIFFDRPWTGNKGLESLDKETHYFGAAGDPSDRPNDVNRRRWARQVNLPRTWHHGTVTSSTSNRVGLY